jgi:UDP:flavonoid glycosyltransferase YjiC (YdhE family)
VNSLNSTHMKDKKPILMVFPLDFAAHYFRCLEFCKKLSHQFEIFFADSAKYDKYIRSAGFETFKTANFNSEEITAAASSFDFSWLNLKAIETILESQIKAIEERKPSLVLGDASFTLKIAAEMTNVPFVSLLNGYMTKYCRVTRKVSPSHPGYAYSKTMPKRVFERLTRVIEHAMLEKVHEPFRKTRKKLDLTKRHYLLEELEGDYNLICDLPSFFPQKKLPENYQFVGPLFYKGDEEEKEVSDFLGDNPIRILVSLGSTGNWKKLNLLLDPVFSDTRIVITGNSCSNLQAANIMSTSFLNHTKIMEKVDIVICHGGNGTVYQALAYGIPLILFSGNFEQEWNIQRIIEMQLGTRLEESFDAAKVRDTVNTWIGKKSKDPFLRIQQEINSFIYQTVTLDSNNIFKKN